MTPWLDAEVARRSRLMLRSHLRLTGTPLLAGIDPAADEAPRALYEAPVAALAHDGAADPRFTYANLTAQTLWELEWPAFIGMPSRLSAEPDLREERQRLLERAARDGFVADYAGVRVTRSGRRFRVERATVWNLVDEAGARHGQAAAFSQWIML